MCLMCEGRSPDEVDAARVRDVHPAHVERELRARQIVVADSASCHAHVGSQPALHLLHARVGSAAPPGSEQGRRARRPRSGR